MKIKAVPSSWIQSEGRRLDVGLFLHGAVEARKRIRRLDAPKELLKNLTVGPEGGIFNGPQFSRLWVTDPAHGVPFLGSSSMLLADLSHLPLLSRKRADFPKLRQLEVNLGVSGISRSGAIGAWSIRIRIRTACGASGISCEAVFYRGRNGVG